MSCYCLYIDAVILLHLLFLQLFPHIFHGIHTVFIIFRIIFLFSIYFGNYIFIHVEQGIMFKLFKSNNS